MVINMECLIGMRMTLADNSIDAVVTDPPYGLSKQPDMNEVLRHWLNGDDYVHTGGGFMGKTWDSFVPGPSIWKEVFRVLKPGGHLLAFFGTRTYDLGTLAIRLAGFEIRDQIDWVYGSGFPKSLDVSKATGDEQWQGWGTALKPAHEPICVARKPLAGTVAENVLQFGTGGMNIDSCRVNTDEILGRPQASSQSGVMSMRLAANGYNGSSDDRGGRWPANFIHDGSDEVISLFPAKAGAAAPVKGTEASQASTGNVIGQRERVPGAFHADSGSAARFFKVCQLEDEDWLDQNLPIYLVSFAEKCLPLQSLLDVFVASPVVTEVHHGGNLLKNTQNLFTYDTLNQLRNVCEINMQMIQIIENGVLQGILPERLTLSHNHVKSVVNLTQTDTMTITISQQTSDGYVALVTFNITLKNLGVGEKDLKLSTAKFKYCAKASKSDRDEGVMLAMVTGAEMTGREPDTDGLNSPRAGAGRTSGARNNHPTVKPTALMQWLVRLVTPPGGKVLDPFTGSGSTGKACAIEGFDFIGFEMDPHYCEIAKQRINYVHNR